MRAETTETVKSALSDAARFGLTGSVVAGETVLEQAVVDAVIQALRDGK